MSNAEANSTTVNDTQPKIKILRDTTLSQYNPWWIITSLLITVFISLFIYIVLDFYYLELITRDTTLMFLQWSGLPATKTTALFPFDSSPTWGQFGEASLITPGITIANTNYPAFWIVKACTGMQAGAILIALIYVTPLPLKGKLLRPDLPFNELSFKERFRVNHPFLYSFSHKTIVAMLFLIILFIANSIRIWFHLWLVGAWGLPFSFAHDDLSKPIGFVGTLIFAWVIEKSGIPIIDTFADWMDAAYLALKHVYNSFV